jgi:type IV pilus assembly protein PilA
MLRKLTQRIQSEESGFTLIELLVVILIIGILAAIALPAFLGQQKKGQDASSKSDARNLVSQIEACFANEQAYTNCMPKADGTLGGDATGLSIGSGGGQVTAATSGNGYVVTATSKSTNTFKITKADDGSTSRSCLAKGSGGCPTSGNW